MRLNALEPIITLRPLDSTDINDLVQNANDERVASNLRDFFPNPYTTANAEWFYNHVSSQRPEDDLVISLDGRLVGIIGIVPGTDIYRNTAEIGYWIGHRHWGKGFATAALRLMARYAFETRHFSRLYAGVFSTNIASMRALEKCGFKHEGILRANVTKNGLVLDEHRYGLLAIDVDREG